MEGVVCKGICAVSLPSKTAGRLHLGPRRLVYLQLRVRGNHQNRGWNLALPVVSLPNSHGLAEFAGEKGTRKRAMCSNELQIG
jgi:hypothetical protein